jgi:hypothetical protein
MASISLALCILELVIVWGAVVVVRSSGQQIALLRLMAVAWIGGGLTSILCAIAAIVVDSRREIGVLALIASGVVFLICGLPMLA